MCTQIECPLLSVVTFDKHAVALFLYFTAYSEVHLTQQSPLGSPCSGETVVLQCTLQGTAVIWSFPGGDETLVPSSSEQVTGNFRVQPVGVANGNFTSTLTFPAENGTCSHHLFQCTKEQECFSDSYCSRY